jgi:hypothetical protein
MRLGPFAAAFATAVLSFEPAALAKGKIIEFDPPNSVETLVFLDSPNIHGDVVGSYYEDDGIGRAFIRSRNGKFSDLGQTLSGPEPIAINAHDEITGNDENGHGFIVSGDGTTISFDVPGADGSGYGTNPTALDNKDNVAGFYSKQFQFNLHGFLRDAKGHFTRFDAPHAGSSTDQGTYVLGSNANLEVTGYATTTTMSCSASYGHTMETSPLSI